MGVEELLEEKTETRSRIADTTNTETFIKYHSIMGRKKFQEQTKPSQHEADQHLHAKSHKLTSHALTYESFERRQRKKISPKTVSGRSGNL